MTQEKTVQPFDEKAALAELERLREMIQAARRARQRTSDEFEAFVKSFRTPTPTSTPETRVATSSVLEAPQQAAAESIDPPLQSSDPLPPTVPLPSNPEPLDDRTAPLPARAPRRHRLSIRSLGICAVIAVVALGLLSTRWRRQQSPPPRVIAAADNTASTRNAGTSTPPAPPPAPAAHGVVLDLRLVRPVWMRVVVDGRKDVEGMVQGGQPLHFTGDRSIVVRVGNGGDVLVKTGNREEPFGDAGQPLTRTFSKP